MESSPHSDIQNPQNIIPEPNKKISFTRRGFTTIDGMDAVVEEFREYYLNERKAFRTDLMQIFREFRKHKEIHARLWFNPYPNVVKGWMRRWEQSLPITIRRIPIKGRDVVEAQKDEKQLIKDIAYEDLEMGAKNLQSLLVDEAQQLLKESNAEYELIDEQGGFWDKHQYEKIRAKKKEIALAIAKEVLSGVHKHELVKLKKNKEGRETAGFLMDLMRQSSAGELTDQDMELLEQGING